MIVILSNPQMGENIGAVARVMSNFGITDLRIISPRDGWPNPKADAMAAGGEFILRNASIHQNLASALADVQFLVGTSGNIRQMNKDVFSSHELTAQLANKSGLAVIFGCERTGLSNEELSHCNAIINIPTSEINSSLNLAQAVAIVCYEYSKLNISFAPPSAPLEMAENQEVEHMLQFLQAELETLNFFKSPEMKPTMMRNITNIFTNRPMSKQELRTLYGIFKLLQRP